jgi:hypothetical protein
LDGYLAELVAALVAALISALCIQQRRHIIDYPTFVLTGVKGDRPAVLIENELSHLFNLFLI